MGPNRKRLILEQLDATFDRLSCLRSVQRPAKGWLRAIRGALGMSGKQFAKRLAVSPPRVTVLEKEELTGSVTIKTMRHAAEALDCFFVYALVPRTTLSKTVRERAEATANKRLERISHSMLLEDQQLSQGEQQKALRAEIEELIRTMPKERWDDPDGL